jgi:3-oxoacyl-[acyl-carrier protein] reductase
MPITTPQILGGIRALVVGGGGDGMGYAITDTLAAAGADVAVVDIAPERADESAENVVRHGRTGIGIAADIRDPADCERLVERAREALGGLDVVVTVVGGLMAWRVPFDRLDRIGDEVWDFVLDVNLRYVARVLRPALRIIREQGTGGSVITLGSDAGTGGYGSPNMAAYGVAKAGLAHLVKSLAAEYGPDGIRVNMVSPGSTRTGSTSALTDAKVDAMQAVIPLRRRGRPEDIANAVLFFASDLSRQVTGQILGVDGGISIQSPMPDLHGITTAGATR